MADRIITFQYAKDNIQDLRGILSAKAYAELNNNSMHWVYRMLYIGGGDVGFRKGMKELGYSGKFIWMTLERLKKSK